jgi:Excalibur calcium-binding domain
MYLPPLHHRLAVLAVAVVLAGCGENAEGDPDNRPNTTPATAFATSPTANPESGEVSGGEAEDEDQPVTAVDCAAYVDSDEWCADGAGDYDCEGGEGNGPNYAPPEVELADTGTDPFGLDDDDDGTGCDEPDAAEQAPPPADDSDPWFDTCGDAIDAGYGPYYRGQDPEYDWYRDADDDGVVCE